MVIRSRSSAGLAAKASPPSSKAAAAPSDKVVEQAELKSEVVKLMLAAFERVPLRKQSMAGICGWLNISELKEAFQSGVIDVVDVRGSTGPKALDQLLVRLKEGASRAALFAWHATDKFEADKLYRISLDQSSADTQLPWDLLPDWLHAAREDAVRKE